MTIKRFAFISLIGLFLVGCISCSSPENPVKPAPGGEEKDNRAEKIELARRDLLRAMSLAASARTNYFSSDGTAMSRYYNPYTGLKSSEKGSVWMFTSAIEAVNSVLHGLTALRDAGDESFYNSYFSAYSSMLSELVENLKWYEGTYTLTSYTQTKKWTVYGVNRASSPGRAEVDGIKNVYDDQQWLLRELIEAYRLTGVERYLEKAEYLAEYVIDGWDTTLDSEGKEHGGIVWGPGYYTKHSCSNGPFVSPLVWLSEIYSGKPDEVTYRYIGANKARLTKQMNKGEYYLMYAKKVYDFQRSHLYRKSTGVYADMLGAKGWGGDNIAYETVDGVRYRGHNEEESATGEAYSYNSGTMLSGAADLYRVTGEQAYLDDMKSLSTSSFLYFAKKSAERPGYYEYAIDGFNNWFNGVLMRGWVDVSAHYGNVALNIGTFQSNLDYAWGNYLNKSMLPTSLLYGWNKDKSKNKVEAMFTFAYAAEYAVLAKWHLSQIE